MYTKGVNRHEAISNALRELREKYRKTAPTIADIKETGATAVSLRLNNPSAHSFQIFGSDGREASITPDEAISAMEYVKKAMATPVQPQTAPKETQMPPTEAKPTLAQTLTADATDASWRVGASQFTKLVRDPLAAMLARNLAPDDPAIRGRIAAFLDTELGAAMLAGMLSIGLSAIPAPAGSQAAVNERLARELRVKSMEGVGGSLADVLMGPLRDVMSTYLAGATTEAQPPAGLPDGARVGVGEVVGERVTP